MRRKKFKVVGIGQWLHELSLDILNVVFLFIKSSRISNAQKKCKSVDIGQWLQELSLDILNVVFLFIKNMVAWVVFGHLNVVFLFIKNMIAWVVFGHLNVVFLFIKNVVAWVVFGHSECCFSIHQEYVNHVGSSRRSGADGTSRPCWTACK